MISEFMPTDYGVIMRSSEFSQRSAFVFCPFLSHVYTFGKILKTKKNPETHFLC